MLFRTGLKVCHSKMAMYITHYQKDTAMQLNFKLNNYNTI